MKRFISYILSILMVCSVFFGLNITASSAEATSGSCGDTATYNFDIETSTLTISGTGAIDDYESGSAPWYSYAQNIEKLVISEGITAVGHYAFYNCESLTDATIPEGVTKIGEYAFDSCTSLEIVTIPESITDICQDAFYCYLRLSDVDLPDNIKEINNLAFTACHSLKK